jgi:metal-responsive CopG/Arc/MetJ family transcriptional regulator
MAKIAISLPDEVLQAIEKERLASGLSRSEFFRNAVEAFLRHRRERELEEQYVRGYQENPETAEEIALAEAVMGRVLAENPWDDGASE